MSALVGFNDPYNVPGIGHNGGPTLRDYQNEAVDSLFDYFNTHGGTGPDGLPIKANPLICLPTGTGKSLVIAAFVFRALSMWPRTRVIMATHVKTLIEQNAKKLLSVWPLAPMGIYSAGLNKREGGLPIVFGGVKSLIKKSDILGFRDLLVIDEAHLLASEGVYQQLILELCEANPYLKVIGLTATPYRVGLGHMTNGNIFTDVAYDLCTIEGFNRLLAQGYLCPLVAKRGDTQLDISSVGITAGDYNQGQLENAVDTDTTNYAILKECCEKAYDRASWLIFASGVNHANHLCDMLNSAFGISAVTVHSGNSQTENDANLEAWQHGRVRAAVSMNSLTTGVDHPACDFIAMVRPTMSPGLWVQMLGRGTRPYSFITETNPIIAMAFPYIKQNCLVLDFAGNTKRLGPINDPVIPKKKGDGPPGDAPVKLCSNSNTVEKKGCGAYNHTSARECILCSAQFISHEKLDRTASEMELIRSDMPEIQTYNVQHVVMTEHRSKQSGNDSIKIAYFCGMRTFYEWKSVQTTNKFFKHMSRDWFRQRYHYQNKPSTWDNDVPYTNKEILALSSQLRHPKRISVWVNKNPPEITGYEF